MSLEQIRSRLVSMGYRPEDVDYTIVEILQYKKPGSLDKTDYKILVGLLRKRSGVLAAS